MHEPPGDARPQDDDDEGTSQHERWQYPEPIQDVARWLRHGGWQWFDPSHSSRVLWPDREPRPDLEILVAGCGTNQAAIIAHTNPQATVVAVDVSGVALDHHVYLKSKHGLQNLQLHQLAIEELPGLGAEFDLVMCTGVLHHLADPTAALTALARCLRPDGVLAAMVYAKYGRHGVELLNSLFRDLGLTQNAASLRIVKDAVTLLPATHPVREYLKMSNEGHVDAALVDTFLHPRARSYTVADCLELVNSAGLQFQGWLLNAPYYPHPLVSHSRDFYPAIRDLPPPRLWSAMEKINPTNACHFFMACHPQRPTSAYAIDFSSQRCLDYVPSWRLRCGLRDKDIVRPGWHMTPDATQLPFIAAIDGRCTIREIAASAANTMNPAAAPRNTRDAEKYACTLLGELWRLDFLAMALTSATGPV